MLSHYDAVLWYTGDDAVTRRAGLGRQATPTALAHDEILEFRAYMNEGGRVLYTGACAGQQFSGSGAAGQQFYDPKGEGPCRAIGRRSRTRRSTRAAASGCSARRTATGSTTCSSTGSARMRSRRATGSTRTTGNQFDIAGLDDPFLGLTWGFGGPRAPTTRT